MYYLPKTTRVVVSPSRCLTPSPLLYNAPKLSHINELPCHCYCTVYPRHQLDWFISLPLPAPLSPVPTPYLVGSFPSPTCTLVSSAHSLSGGFFPFPYTHSCLQCPLLVWWVLSLPLPALLSPVPTPCLVGSFHSPTCTLVSSAHSLSGGFFPFPYLHSCLQCSLLVWWVLSLPLPAPLSPVPTPCLVGSFPSPTCTLVSCAHSLSGGFFPFPYLHPCLQCPLLVWWVLSLPLLAPLSPVPTPCLVGSFPSPTCTLVSSAHSLSGGFFPFPYLHPCLQCPLLVWWVLSIPLLAPLSPVPTPCLVGSFPSPTCTLVCSAHSLSGGFFPFPYLHPCLQCPLLVWWVLSLPLPALLSPVLTPCLVGSFSSHTCTLVSSAHSLSGGFFPFPYLHSCLQCPLLVWWVLYLPLPAPLSPVPTPCLVGSFPSPTCTLVSSAHSLSGGFFLFPYLHSCLQCPLLVWWVLSIPLLAPLSPVPTPCLVGSFPSPTCTLVCSAHSLSGGFFPFPYLHPCLQCPLLVWWVLSLPLPALLSPVPTPCLVGSLPSPTCTLVSSAHSLSGGFFPFPYLHPCLQCPLLVWWVLSLPLHALLSAVPTPCLVGSFPSPTCTLVSSAHSLSGGFFPFPYLHSCLQCPLLVWWVLYLPLPAPLSPVPTPCLVGSFPSPTCTLVSSAHSLSGGFFLFPYLHSCLQCPLLVWWVLSLPLPALLSPVPTPCLVGSFPSPTCTLVSSAHSLSGGFFPFPYLHPCLQCSLLVWWVLSLPLPALLSPVPTPCLVGSFPSPTCTLVSSAHSLSGGLFPFPYLHCCLQCPLLGLVGSFPSPTCTLVSSAHSLSGGFFPFPYLHPCLQCSLLVWLVLSLPLPAPLSPVPTPCLMGSFPSPTCTLVSCTHSLSGGFFPFPYLHPCLQCPLLVWWVLSLPLPAPLSPVPTPCLVGSLPSPTCTLVSSAHSLSGGFFPFPYLHSCLQCPLLVWWVLSLPLSAPLSPVPTPCLVGSFPSPTCTLVSSAHSLPGGFFPFPYLHPCLQCHLLVWWVLSLPLPALLSPVPTPCLVGSFSSPTCTLIVSAHSLSGGFFPFPYLHPCLQCPLLVWWVLSLPLPALLSPVPTPCLVGSFLSSTCTLVSSATSLSGGFFPFPYLHSCLQCPLLVWWVLFLPLPALSSSVPAPCWWVLSLPLPAPLSPEPASLPVDSPQLLHVSFRHPPTGHNKFAS